VRLVSLLDLFLLILAHILINVFCPVLPLFPCICWSAVGHTLCRVFLCPVLLPVLGIIIIIIIIIGCYE
jgi:hypothetical protein